MFYKAMQGEIVADVFDKLNCVKYFPRSRAVLTCREDDNPQGIMSSDLSKVWHVNGRPDLPGYEEIRLCEISQEEYGTLKKLLDEGKQPEPAPEPEPPDTDPETLAWAKQQKVLESKKKLAEWLTENPIASYAHGGELGYYAVTEEKQNLMFLNFGTYQMKKNAGLPAELTWNETGEECEPWTEAEYVQLSIEIENYVKPLVSVQQSIEKQIQAATSLEEVDAVEINY